MKRLIACAFACAFSSASAQQDESWFEITPLGGYRLGGSFEIEDSTESYDVEDSPSYGLIINFPHRHNTRWEVLYSKQSTETEYSGPSIAEPVYDLDVQVLQIGGTYQFEGQSAFVVPYLAATLGATHMQVSARSSESDTFWSASMGLGLLISPNSRVGLRLEARGYGTFTNSGTDLLCQSGPEGGTCAIRLDGDLVTQVEAFAGVVFRF
jgi:hypothetical protein